MKDFVIKFLNEKGIDFKIQDNKLIISDEFQSDHYYPDIDMYAPYILTEYNYPHSLNSELTEFNETLEEKFGSYFECEWAGTFSLLLD